MSEKEENAHAQRVIGDLVAGKVSPSQVPPGILPRVNIGLDALKQKMISEGHVDKVKRIHKIQNDIATLRPKYQLAPRSAHRLPPLRRSSEPAVSPAELEALLDSLVDGTPLDPDKGRLVPLLIVKAKERIHRFVREGQLGRAQDYEDLMRTLVVIGGEKTVEFKRTSRRAILAESLERARCDVRKAEENFDLYVAKFQEELEQQREELIAEQDDALAVFDMKTDEGMPETGLKYSQQLLVWREEINAMVAIRQFARAAELKAIADVQQEKEKKELTGKWLELRATLREQLLDAHAAARAAFDEKGERHRLTLKQTLKADIDAKKRAVENLQARLDALEAILRVEAANATMVRPPTKLKSRPLTHAKPGAGQGRTPAERRSAETQTLHGLRNPWPS
jgi:hypothetical protein